MYTEIFNFFFLQEVIFDEKKKFFLLFEETKLIGCINKDNYDDVVNIILKINAVNVDKAEKTLKFKNKRAKEIYMKLQQDPSLKKENNKNEKKMKLGNIISSMSGRRNLNIENIWNITIFQLYDQFHREQKNEMYNIQANSVSIYGDKDNKFDINLWFDCI